MKKNIQIKKNSQVNHQYPLIKTNKQQKTFTSTSITQRNYVPPSIYIKYDKFSNFDDIKKKFLKRIIAKLENYMMLFNLLQREKEVFYNMVIPKIEELKNKK